jgi:hypothetical protein
VTIATSTSRASCSFLSVWRTPSGWCALAARCCGPGSIFIATGASLLPDGTEGLTGAGWEQRVFTFYTLDGSIALRDALDSSGGQIIFA